MIGMGKSMTYKLVASGEIPSVWLAGLRSRRVPAEALDKWVAAQATRLAEPNEAR